MFLELSTVISIQAKLPHSCQPHVVTLLRIFFFRIHSILKRCISHMILLFSHSLALPLCVSLSYKHTDTLQHAHSHTCTTPLKTGFPPYSNFVRSWQCLDLVVWLFRPVFPAALMWTGHPAEHQRIPLHGSRIAGSFYLWSYRNEWVLVSKHFTMLLQPHTKATDFQQICTYFIQDD